MLLKTLSIATMALVATASSAVCQQDPKPPRAEAEIIKEQKSDLPKPKDLKKSPQRQVKKGKSP